MFFYPNTDYTLQVMNTDCVTDVWSQKGAGTLVPGWNALDTEYEFEMRTRFGYMDIYIDGEFHSSHPAHSCDQETLDTWPLQNVYAGDPWYYPADATLSNVIWHENT